MANDSFRVKNTLVVNGAFVANSTVVNAAAIAATAVFVGNSSVNTNIGVGTISISGTIVNSSIYQGTANNANNLGGSSLSTIQNQITGNSASAYSNAVANSAALYQTTAGLSANVATLTSNNSTNFDTLSLATVQSQITGNSASAYSNAVTVASNATNLISGTMPMARLNANAVNTSSAFTITGVHTHSANIVMGNSSVTFTSGSINSTAFSTGTNTATIGTAAYFVGNGNVGIGNTAPSAKLHVQGAILASDNITAYSDARLKENIETIEHALILINNIRGVRYNNKETGSKGIGVIAQEVQSVVPEVVQQHGEYLSVAYGNMVGLLIEAIKELSSEVNIMKAEINQLKGD